MRINVSFGSMKDLKSFLFINYEKIVDISFELCKLSKLETLSFINCKKMKIRCNTFSAFISLA